MPPTIPGLSPADTRAIAIRTTGTAARRPFVISDSPDGPVGSAGPPAIWCGPNCGRKKILTAETSSRLALAPIRLSVSGSLLTINRKAKSVPMATSPVSLNGDLSLTRDQASSNIMKATARTAGMASRKNPHESIKSVLSVYHAAVRYDA